MVHSAWLPRMCAGVILLQLFAKSERVTTSLWSARMDAQEFVVS